MVAEIRGSIHKILTHIQGKLTVLKVVSWHMILFLTKNLFAYYSLKKKLVFFFFLLILLGIPAKLQNRPLFRTCDQHKINSMVVSYLCICVSVYVCVCIWSFLILEFLAHYHLFTFSFVWCLCFLKEWRKKNEREKRKGACTNLYM